MRLSWLLPIFFVLIGSLVADDWTGSSEPTTTPIPVTTTGEPGEGPDTTGSSAASSAGVTVPTEADVTEGTPGPTDAPVTGQTDAPVVTDEPVDPETDDGNTDHTKKPTVAPPTTPKAAPTTTTKGSTTTKEPQPDVESFSVHCDKVSAICTYTMQVPGLDIDTFNSLMLATNETEAKVLDFEGSDLVDLEAGVTKVFDDAQATVDYVTDQLALITNEIKALELQSTTLQNDINSLNTAVYNANDNLNKILKKKSSCLYRQCVLKETTTTRPVTIPTTRTTPTPFCLRKENMGEGDDALCKHGGVCNSKYDSYDCTCTGNLYGEDGTDCVTSVCDVIKDSQVPGLIYSPGYNGTVNNNVEDDDDCDGAQWTVKAVDSDNNVLTLVETDAQFKDKTNTYISQLSADANLQLTVGKYKLKITSKTKNAQIAQILEYGPTATISYNGPALDYFHFTLAEKPKPSPTP